MAISTLEHVTFIASNITNGHDVANVQETARKLEGVTQVHANAETRFVDIDFDPAITSANAISAGLTKAGFPVRT